MNSRSIEVTAADGHQFGAYLSLPPTGTGPGLVLIQEIFGVNQHIRQVADQYALDGFVVVAPDLFSRLEPRIELGYSEKDFETGSHLMKQMDVRTAVQDLMSTAQILRTLPEQVGKIASLGYCMGGLLSYLVGSE